MKMLCCGIITPKRETAEQWAERKTGVRFNDPTPFRLRKYWVLSLTGAACRADLHCRQTATGYTHYATLTETQP